MTSLTSRDHVSSFACRERRTDIDRTCWASSTWQGGGQGSTREGCEVEASPLSKLFVPWTEQRTPLCLVPEHLHLHFPCPLSVRWAASRGGHLTIHALSGAVVSPASPPRGSKFPRSIIAPPITHFFIEHASPGTQSDSAAPPPSRSAQADGPAAQTREAAPRRGRVRQAADLPRLSVRD